MTATLLGSYSLGDAIPGLKSALSTTGQALQSIRGTVDSAIDSLGTLRSALNTVATEVDSTKNALTAGPVDEVNDAIDTAQDLLSNLLTLDAADYLSDTIAGLNSAIALIGGLTASTFLADAISGVEGAIDGQQTRLDSLVEDVNSLTDIADDVRTRAAALGVLANTLQAASDNAVSALVAYNQQISEMLNTGVYVVAYNGALSSLGTEVDAVLPDTGVGSSTNVAGPLLIVESSNTAALAALNNAFGL
jgi:hypothetical protein